jgi:tetratricopeptide (TPR) repeat protein
MGSMIASTARRLCLALALVTLAAGVGLVSIRSSQTQLAVIEACDAVERGDLERALALTRERVGPSDTGRAAAECRCRALLARGNRLACAELLESVWVQPAGADWMPSADLAAHAIATRRAMGRTHEAATLAARAGRAYPNDSRLFALELDARASVEMENQVLRELAVRLPSDGLRAAELRSVLAQRHLRAGDPGAALKVLGPTLPPGASGTGASLWFDTRAVAFAMADDLRGVRRTIAEWGAAGGDPAELRARYALALSIAGLTDPERDTITLLREALEANEDSPDMKLREGLVVRLVLSLASAKRLEEALALYDRYRDALPSDGLQREELERAARAELLSRAPAAARRGALVFQLTDLPEDAVLLVSPDADAPVDADYERFEPPAGGLLALERTEGEAPPRWVVRTGDRVLGSGVAHPIAGDARPVEIAMREEARIPTPHLRARPPGDGRRRVLLLLLDCGDWRIIRYLMARGELPVLAALLRDGHRAVLDSDPPLTAAALEALVWPLRRGDASLLGLVHRMGGELAGLSSVGENPFEEIAWVLPESDDLFSTLAAGGRSAANLLLSHGGIRAGRHGEVSGPNGGRRRVEIGRTARDLDPKERERWPGLANPGSDRDRLYVRTIAAEFDATEMVLREDGIDFAAVRIEPLDILTHAHFGVIAAEGQDDGRGLLYDVYRYIDARLAAIDTALDEDDVLIVMSDHGIRTAMEHARESFFVAVGGGAPPGRAEGTPAIRGVSRAVADLLGVATDWPDTGVAPWASQAPLAAAPTGASQTSLAAAPPSADAAPEPRGEARSR